MTDQRHTPEPLDRGRYQDVLLIGGPYDGACFDFKTIRVNFLFCNERVMYQARHDGERWTASLVDPTSPVDNPVWIDWESK